MSITVTVESGGMPLTCIVPEEALGALDGGLSLDTESLCRIYRRRLERAALAKRRPASPVVELTARDLRFA